MNTKTAMHISNAFFLVPLLDVLAERGDQQTILDLDRRFHLLNREESGSLDVDAVIEILETVVNKLGVHDIGLRMAAKHTASSYGALGKLMESAGIFIDVIDSYVRHFDTISTIVTPKFERPAKGEFEILFTFNYRHRLLENVLGEMLLFSLQDNISQLLGETCKPTKVNLTAQHATEASKYNLVFTGSLEFSESVNSMNFDAYWLSRYLDNEDKVFDYLLNKLIILSGDEHKVSDLYELLLVVYNCLEVDHCFNQAEVAKYLGFSKRTLVRRYQSINIKFTELIDIFRRRKSIDLLSERALTINEIAYRLGFWERSTFDKKFRIWYGITPAKMKKVFLQQDTNTVTHFEAQQLPEFRSMH